MKFKTITLACMVLCLLNHMTMQVCISKNTLLLRIYMSSLQLLFLIYILIDIPRSLKKNEFLHVLMYKSMAKY